jgi:ATP-binding protein involved in chromosome partitioning
LKLKDAFGLAMDSIQLVSKALFSSGVVSAAVDEGISDLESRIIGVRASSEPGHYFLDIDSSGLTLAQKLLIERLVARAMAGAEAEFQGRLSVYFKKTRITRSYLKPESSAAEPVPVRGVKDPFGLDIRRKPIPGVRRVIVVASGKGGVGKSTVSANLAVSLAKAGERVGLLDADVYGPSMPLMFGIQNRPQISDEQKLEPLVRHGVRLMSFGFLTDYRTPLIWRGPMISKAIVQFCFDVQWGELDYLVVDLPPGTGDVQLTLIERLPLDYALIVSTPQDVALVDAHKALSMFRRLNIPVLGMVENMSHHVCSNCGHVDEIFGAGGIEKLANERQLPILARVPLHRSVRAGGDEGVPVSLQGVESLSQPFAELANRVLERL